MENTEFEKLVAEGYEQLPEWVREKIKNVALLVEDEPTEEVREREGLGEDETLLGYYHGIPLAARGEMYGVGVTMPDTITIYREPILDAASEELLEKRTYDVLLKDIVSPVEDTEAYKDAVRRIVAETVWHEFAHHFGMDEHEVRDREAKRDSHT